MKIRNGFVSNSSSSSFIINYPKEPLRLNQIEDYFGGYNEDVPEGVRDLMNFILWRNQFNSELEPTNYKDYDCCLTDEERHIKCPYNRTYCINWMCEEDECKYYKELSGEEVLNNLITCYWGESKEQLENIKTRLQNISQLEIDDNNTDDDLPLRFNDRYTINNWAGDLFKSHDNIVESGR